MTVVPDLRNSGFATVDWLGASRRTELGARQVPHCAVADTNVVLTAPRSSRDKEGHSGAWHGLLVGVK